MTKPEQDLHAMSPEQYAIETAIRIRADKICDEILFQSGYKKSMPEVTTHLRSFRDADFAAGERAGLTQIMHFCDGGAGTGCELCEVTVAKIKARLAELKEADHD